MTAILRSLMRDEAGLILSAELVIILTVAVLGMIVGLVNLQTAILGEFTDLGLAFQSLNQSYYTPSYRGCWKWWGPTSWVAGSRFYDYYDGCVGGAGYGGGCEIYSSSAYGVSPVTSGCATGNCPTNNCTPGTVSDAAVNADIPASPALPTDAPLQPTPDPASGK